MANNPHPMIDYTAVVYTTHDIEKTEYLNDLQIRGLTIGEKTATSGCRAVRLYLRNKSPEAVPSTNYHPRQPSHPSSTGRTTKVPKEWDRLHNQRPDNLETNEATTSTPSTSSWNGPIITFAVLPQTATVPPLIWKVHVPPNPDVCLETITILDGALNTTTRSASSGEETILRSQSPSPTHIYLNGYQSWSYAGSVAKGKPQPKSANPDVFNKAFDEGGSLPPIPNTVIGPAVSTEPKPGKKGQSKKAPYVSSFFACITGTPASDDEQQHGDLSFRDQPGILDETGGPACVIGWLSQHQQLGVVAVDSDLESRLAMHASCDTCHLVNGMETDWAVCQLLASHHFDEEPMAQYLTMVAAHNDARPLTNGPLLTGWCSWYHYYSGITGANLRENFGNLHKLRNTIPTNVAVVDDGYMTAWGDWDSLKPKKFPNGLGGVSRDISSQGMRPGLWLAPYACDKHSVLAKQHPEWILRNYHGRPANSAFCGKFFYGLDVTNPEVREHVYSCVRRAVRDWNYSVLKIDFLYAAVLVGNSRHDLTMTRAQAMHMALQTIRAAAGPDVFLIGCGCPLGAGIGYVDGMRVSADTGPTWFPEFPCPYWDNSTLPSLRGMIRNSVSRAPLGHRWWHNDPDCLLLGKTTRLTNIQVASAASIVAMTCGMLLLSDDLTRVPPDRIGIVTKIYPMTGATAIVLNLHNNQDGFPNMLRLWCTDRHHHDLAAATSTKGKTSSTNDKDDPNAEATRLGRLSSFSPDIGQPQTGWKRKRSCVHVAPGLGTWTLLSVSNWSGRSTTVRIPRSAMMPPSAESSQYTFGFHVFFFWSGTYQWIPDPRGSNVPHHQWKYPVQKTLVGYETELIHVRPIVNPKLPCYVGSSLHFSCGYEVRSMQATEGQLTVQLRNDLVRSGFVYLYLPVPKLQAIDVMGATSWDAFASTPDATTTTHNNNNDNDGNPRVLCIGRIIRVGVTIHGDKRPDDGMIVIKF